MGTPIKLLVVQRTGRIYAFLLIRLKFLPLCYIADFFESRKEKSDIFVEWIRRY